MKLLKRALLMVSLAGSFVALADSRKLHTINYESLDAYLENPVFKVTYMIALSYLGNKVGRGLLAGLNAFFKKKLNEQDFDAAGFAGIIAAHVADGVTREDIDPMFRAIAFILFGVPTFGPQ